MGMTRIPDRIRFFVGGRYREVEGVSLMRGQMFVEHLAAPRPAALPPVVMVHGKWQTGVNYLATPDGRPGWAFDFNAAGFPVYVVDQVARGRSAAFPEDGPLGHRDAEYLQRMFTATDEHMLWPQARLHAQWPGGRGVIGNPSFDQFMASQTPALAEPEVVEDLNTEALLALLEEIGPSLLITHSESGAFGWRVADARPDLVKAVVALEPGGPPFRDVDYVGPPDFFAEIEPVRRPWGITRGRLRFDPPLAQAADLRPVRQTEPDGEGLVRGWLPAYAGRLPNLASVPVAVVTGEASFHAAFDHLTVSFLRRFGVQVAELRLAEHGLPGNGHMLMLEKNSHQVADLLIRWTAEALGLALAEPHGAGSC
jgi:pimeloyl-ACP methyl ester carboxylesterase